MSTDIALSNTIKEGDAVIIYLDFQTSSILKLTSTGSFDNKFGRFLHKDIIGKEYGSKIHARNGYIYVLKPSPALITQSLPHRTQILYSVDISVIILKLDLKPGSIVVESGTGSGSLSSSLATVIGPKGFLYTFEFNQDRAEKVQKEFDNLGFKNIKVTWRDACKDGFLPKENEDYPLKQCDAVFLDLPKPWEAIPHANKVLKRGGRICCFSPCIEQVQKTCLELKAQKFIEVRTFECIARTYERRKNPYKSLSQGAGNKKRRGGELEGEKPVIKKLEVDPSEQKAPEGEDKVQEEAEGNQEKPLEEEKVETVAQGESQVQNQTQGAGQGQTQIQKEPIKPRKEFYFTSGSQFSQGHTGYLTFAIKM